MVKTLSDGNDFLFILLNRKESLTAIYWNIVFFYIVVSTLHSRSIFAWKNAVLKVRFWYSVSCCTVVSFRVSFDWDLFEWIESKQIDTQVFRTLDQLKTISCISCLIACTSMAKNEKKNEYFVHYITWQARASLCGFFHLLFQFQFDWFTIFVNASHHLQELIHELLTSNYLCFCLVAFCIHEMDDYFQTLFQHSRMQDEKLAVEQINRHRKLTVF